MVGLTPGFSIDIGLLSMIRVDEINILEFSMENVEGVLFLWPQGGYNSPKVVGFTRKNFDDLA